MFWFVFNYEIFVLSDWLLILNKLNFKNCIYINEYFVLDIL